MDWFFDAWEWVAHSYTASIFGGLLALTISIGFSWRSDRAFKQGFEIESIRLMLQAIWWLIAFVWWKL